MKRLNYYQIHKNKQPKKLKLQTIKKKHVSFVISVNTKNIEEALNKVRTSLLFLGKAIIKFENN